MFADTVTWSFEAAARGIMVYPPTTTRRFLPLCKHDCRSRTPLNVGDHGLFGIGHASCHVHDQTRGHRGCVIHRGCLHIFTLFATPGADVANMCSKILNLVTSTTCLTNVLNTCTSKCPSPPMNESFESRKWLWNHSNDI